MVLRACQPRLDYFMLRNSISCTFIFTYYVLFPKSLQCLLFTILSNVYNILRDLLSYLPTPPLGQDMTQGQFLSGVEQV